MTAPHDLNSRASRLSGILASELDLALQPLNHDGLAGYTIQWRVKSEASIARKLNSKKQHQTSGGAPAINDYIGIRVIVLHIGLIHDTVQIVRGWANFRGLRFLEFGDAFATPALGKYRSVHLDFELRDPKEWGLTTAHGIEIQLTTYLQNLHGMISRESLYKHRNDLIGGDVSTELEILSNQLSDIDDFVARITSRLQQK